jgi:hypothetical protein
MNICADWMNSRIVLDAFGVQSPDNTYNEKDSIFLGFHNIWFYR